MLMTRMNRSCCTPTAASFPVNNFARSIDQLVESVLSPELPGITARAVPPLNVWEDTESIYVEGELPGFAIEDLDITLAENQLTISGTRNPQAPEGASFIRRERPSGKFTRVIRIATDIDAARVTAALKDGVLTITLPKSAEVKPRKIAVTTK